MPITANPASYHAVDVALLSLQVIALINEAQMVDKINKMQCLNQVYGGLAF